MTALTRVEESSSIPPKRRSLVRIKALSAGDGMGSTLLILIQRRALLLGSMNTASNAAAALIKTIEHASRVRTLATGFSIGCTLGFIFAGMAGCYPLCFRRYYGRRRRGTRLPDLGRRERDVNWGAMPMMGGLSWPMAKHAAEASLKGMNF